MLGVVESEDRDAWNDNDDRWVNENADDHCLEKSENPLCQGKGLRFSLISAAITIRNFSIESALVYQTILYFTLTVRI